MKNDDIIENVLQCGKEGVKQNIMEALDEFCDEYADEMYRAVEEIIRLRAENAALKEKLEKAVELPCKIGDRFYIVEYYPPEIIEEECCDFSFIELSKILLDNGCGVTYELGDNGCFFVTLDKNEAIRIYNQKKEEQND